MKPKGRDYIPGLAGEFLHKRDIRLRAREYFLWTVNMMVPEPLYVLRDQVFPQFQAAFGAELDSGKSPEAVKNLTIFALLDLAFPDESVDLKSLPEYQAMRNSAGLIYEAIEGIVKWGKQFNLTGKRNRTTRDAPPGSFALDRTDAVWPLVVGLETILQWHFVHHKAVETIGGVPLFRCMNVAPPRVLEDLPQIQLRTAACDPRIDIPKEILETMTFMEHPLAAPPAEVNTPEWHVEWEPESYFRERLMRNFKDWMNSYIDNRKGTARSAGLVQGPGKRELAHFLWTARYQITGTSARIIAKENRGYGVTEGGVEKAVQGILNLIGLERRGAKPGRRAARPTPLDVSPRRSQSLRDFLLRVAAAQPEKP